MTFDTALGWLDTIRHGPARYREFSDAGLLNGLGPWAKARQFARLSRLVRSGLPTRQLVSAAADGRLAHLVMRDALVRPGPRYTLEQIAAQSEIPVYDVERWFRAMGRGVDSRTNRDYSDADLQLAEVLVEYRRIGLDELGLFAAARILGRHLWSVADAIEGLVELRLGDAGNDPELPLQLASHVSRLGHFHANILEHLIATRLTPSEDHAGRDVRRELGVGFADLVGFTSLGEMTEPAELADLAERLDRVTTEACEPPVRFVKTVGDAVMVISTDANALVATFQRIFAAARVDGLPPLHAGIAWGPALPRAGDWIGRTVNLAARVSAVATSDTILIDQATRDRLDLAQLPSEPAGTYDLKGYDGGRELYRLCQGPTA